MTNPTMPGREQEIRARAYVAELNQGLKDLSELVSNWHGRATRAEARVAELEADRAAAVRRALEDAAKRQREFVLSDEFVCDDWEAALTVVDLIDPVVATPACACGHPADEHSVYDCACEARPDLTATSPAREQGEEAAR